jgi:hypothetical protein
VQEKCEDRYEAWYHWRYPAPSVLIRIPCRALLTVLILIPSRILSPSGEEAELRELLTGEPIGACVLEPLGEQMAAALFALTFEAIA